MAGAKALAVWLVLAILASNPLQAVAAACSRKCLGKCTSACCIKNAAPCSFYAPPLNQTITIQNACLAASDPLLANPPWW